MDVDTASDLLRHTLVLTVMISAPILVIGLIVGVSISLLQAITQIHDQTLTFVPKIVAMVAAAIVLMPWVGQRLIEYSTAMFAFGPMP